MATGNHEGEFIMTLPQSTTTAEPSLGRDVLRAVRYYLGSRWALLGLSSLAVIAGLAFGGWGWLVAAGLAPVILSTLPCLVMCAFGVCMACRSNKTQSTALHDPADPTSSPTTLGAVRMDQSIAGGSSYGHGESDQPLPQQVKQVRLLDERSDSHA
jgi:hypothetical protein